MAEQDKTVTTSEDRDVTDSPSGYLPGWWSGNISDRRVKCDITAVPTDRD